MWQDYSGSWHESRPGEMFELMNKNGQARDNWQKQPQSGPQTENVAQTGTQKGESFPHRQADIIFLKRPEQMDGIEVKPGYDQIFAAEDDSWFAVKSAIGNGYTTRLYPVAEPPKAPQQIDTSLFVTHEQLHKQLEEVLPGVVSAAVLNLSRQQEGKKDGNA